MDAGRGAGPDWPPPSGRDRGRRRVGERHAQVLSSLPGVAVTAIADLDPQRARPLADAVGAVAHATPEALLDAGGVDALYVCTPPFARGHAECLAAERGLPCSWRSRWPPTWPRPRRWPSGWRRPGSLPPPATTGATSTSWPRHGPAGRPARPASSPADGSTRSRRPPGGSAGRGRAARWSSRPRTWSTWPATWWARSSRWRRWGMTCGAIDGDVDEASVAILGFRNGAVGRWPPPACSTASGHHAGRREPGPGRRAVRGRAGGAGCHGRAPGHLRQRRPGGGRPRVRRRRPPRRGPGALRRRPGHPPACAMAESALSGEAVVLAA